MTTKKLIIIIVIIVAVVILLIVFVPKSKASNPNTNGGGSGTGGSGTGGGNNGTGGPTAGTKNFDASTWKVGDMIYASRNTPAECQNCLTPNWYLNLIGNNYHWDGGTAMGTFLNFSGSTVTFSNNGYTYTTLIGNQPYTIGQ